MTHSQRRSAIAALVESRAVSGGIWVPRYLLCGLSTLLDVSLLSVQEREVANSVSISEDWDTAESAHAAVADRAGDLAERQWPRVLPAKFAPEKPASKSARRKMSRRAKLRAQRMELG